MTRLSPRERKLVIGAGAALALYLLLDFAVFPWLDTLGETRAAAEMQARRVSNYRRILQQQDSTRFELAHLRQRTRFLEQWLLDSAGDALAGAEIQGLVRDIAAAHGLTIGSSDLAPVEPVSSLYSKVSTRVSFTGGIRQFVDFTAAMGSGPKILFVEDLRIAPDRADRPEEKDIRVTLSVAGLKQAEPEKAAGPAGRGGAPGAARGRRRP